MRVSELHQILKMNALMHSIHVLLKLVVWFSIEFISRTWRKKNLDDPPSVSPFEIERENICTRAFELFDFSFGMHSSVQFSGWNNRVIETQNYSTKKIHYEPKNQGNLFKITGQSDVSTFLFSICQQLNGSNIIMNNIFDSELVKKKLPWIFKQLIVYRITVFVFKAMAY